MLHRIRKRVAIEYAGGECQICGYHNFDGALLLHHLDPKVKEHSFNSISINLMRKELPKCILLCFNCHQELHGGFVKLSKQALNKYTSRININDWLDQNYERIRKSVILPKIDSLQKC